MAGDTGQPAVKIVGTGRWNTNTANWEYDNEARLAYRWPNGVKQVPTLEQNPTGTVPPASSPRSSPSNSRDRRVAGDLRKKRKQTPGVQSRTRT